MTRVEVKPGDGILVTRNLTKIYGERVALEKVSVAIEKGKTTVIIGQSGCGKTVFMKHLIALERPTEGEVFFKGQRIDQLHNHELAEVRTSFGFCFQMGALFDSLTVYENIIFPIQQHREIKDFKVLGELVKLKLALVGMDGYQHQYPASLSGGQKKRVSLARAIALNPEVVLYDEPTTGLDPITSDVINELIIKLQRELKITSVVVTHDMKSAYKIADRIIMLHRGKIAADGDADYIRNHPSEVVRQFIEGRIGEADLAALRLGGTKFPTQFQPEDFSGT
ncbi:MAG: ATP-binding cassette domain-containing protein [Planctomycetes bacterium]|nr:ATP-binding cassette domain-containing protein [Planctomycetota bacterium]